MATGALDEPAIAAFGAGRIFSTAGTDHDARLAWSAAWRVDAAGGAGRRGVAAEVVVFADEAAAGAVRVQHPAVAASAGAATAVRRLPADLHLIFRLGQELLHEGRWPIGGSKEVDRFSRSRQCDVEQPPFLGMGLGLGVGQHHCQHRIVGDLRGKAGAPGLKAEHDDMIGLQPLGAMHRQEGEVDAWKGALEVAYIARPEELIAAEQQHREPPARRFWRHRRLQQPENRPQRLGLAAFRGHG